MPRDVEKKQVFFWLRIQFWRQDGRSFVKVVKLPISQVDAGAFQIRVFFWGVFSYFLCLSLLQGSVAKLKLGQRCKRWSISWMPRPRPWFLNCKWCRETTAETDRDAGCRFWIFCRWHEVICDEGIYIYRYLMAMDQKLGIIVCEILGWRHFIRGAEEYWQVRQRISLGLLECQWHGPSKRWGQCWQCGFFCRKLGHHAGDRWC